MDNTTTKIEKCQNASGTSLQGYVTVSYNTLKNLFGEPHDRNGDKSTVDWCFKEKDTDVVFTIYDYKWVSSQNDEIEDFHVGGFDQRSVILVNKLIKGE